MDHVKERDAAEDNERDDRVLLFVVIDFGNQIAGGDVERDARRERLGIKNGRFDAGLQ